MRQYSNNNSRVGRGVKSYNPEDNPHTCSAYIHKIGTACFHLRKRGNFKEADKVAWRVLHALNIKKPEDILKMPVSTLLARYEGTVRGPLATIFFQVGDSLSRHGEAHHAFEFLVRAGNLFPDDQCIKLLKKISSNPFKDPAYTKAYTNSPIAHIENDRIDRLFRTVRSGENEDIVNFDIKEQFFPDCLESVLEFTKTLQNLLLCPEKKENKAAILSDIITYSFGALELFGLGDDPLELCSRSEIKPRLPRESQNDVIKNISSVYETLSKAFLAIGDLERGEACNQLNLSFKDALNG